MKLELRAWQDSFVRQLARHRADDFLLVACPAAGKTIAAGAGAGTLLEQRGADQMVIVAPTVVVRDQWSIELGKLGFRMQVDFGLDGWPEHVHGVCATYAQVAHRAERYAAACHRRPTVVVFDEIHHVGAQKSWGSAIETAFGGAAARLMLSGTPFRSDRDRIPFVRYDQDGACLPDFAYTYREAVRDGACRAVEFRVHDGSITWRDDDLEHTARFTERIHDDQISRRLRASLDPSQGYMAALLADAHADLLELRSHVPDAGGLVVCDTQAHALEVDRLITEITGTLPVLAISDVPRAHEAIKAFNDDDEQWLVSVRMVAEGVDIPRLGVIAWATATRTELMVRQVVGRALRGRGVHANLPAIVHIPADPDLVAHASCLDVLGGVSLRRGDKTTPRMPAERPRSGPKDWTGLPSTDERIDPAPFLEWFDRQAAATSARDVLQRVGWSYDAGLRMLSHWRNGSYADTLKLYDACHMANIDFDVLFAADEYAAARAWTAVDGRPPLDFGTINAQPSGDAAASIRPDLPAVRQRAAVGFAVTAPELPPSPAEIKAAADAHEAARADLFRLLNTYVMLRRAVDPSYQFGSAHADLRTVLTVDREADATVEQLGTALQWIRTRASELARQHPEHLRQVARTQRRLAIA